MILCTILLIAFRGSKLEVGPGKAYSRIEEAVAKAKPGDMIDVYPDPKGYPETAVRILTSLITIRGKADKPVTVKGDRYNYSGEGSVPRAIFQIEPTATGTRIENLDLSGAHNQSYNGAGVRIQGASYVTIDNCIIHDNDMGIMSNGKEGDPRAGSDQNFVHCLIERNGNLKDPGYNHNMYLGGTSAFLLDCEVRNSTTGHNVKSRAHFTFIRNCYIHDAANREIDLPEAWDTARSNSNAVLVSNLIVKDPKCAGNRGVIHFGQEKGTRVGDIYLSSNVIVTPFASPTIAITCSGSTLFADKNIFLNMEQAKAELWSGRENNKAILSNNRLSNGYDVIEGNTYGKARTETFGLSLPDYEGPPLNPSIIEVEATWLDGEGTKRTLGFQKFHRASVGPRIPYRAPNN